MPSIHAIVAEGWRRSRMMRGIRMNAKTYPAMFSPREYVLPDVVHFPRPFIMLQVSGGHSCQGVIPCFSTSITGVSPTAGKECPPPTTVRLSLEGGPFARYNTAFPARRGTEVAVTGSTRNRLGGASRHVGSNPTPLRHSFALLWLRVGFERESAAKGSGLDSRPTLE